MNIGLGIRLYNFFSSSSSENPELATTDNWNSPTGWTHSGGQVFDFDGSGTTTAYRANFNTVPGTEYEYSVTITGAGAQFDIRDGGTALHNSVGPDTYTGTYTAVNDTFQIRPRAAVAGTVTISLKAT